MSCLCVKIDKRAVYANHGFDGPDSSLVGKADIGFLNCQLPQNTKEERKCLSGRGWFLLVTANQNYIELTLASVFQGN